MNVPLPYKTIQNTIQNNHKAINRNVSVFIMKEKERILYSRKMKETRYINFFDFCPIKYDFVLRQVFTRKEFLRFFDYRVRFDETVRVRFY